MRWTRSRDGKHRATIEIRHRVSEDDLVMILSAWGACEIGWPVEDDIELRLSKAATMEAIRNYLAEHGDGGAPYWTDNVDDDSVTAISQWAEEHINRLTGRPITGKAI